MHYILLHIYSLSDISHTILLYNIMPRSILHMLEWLSSQIQTQVAKSEMTSICFMHSTDGRAGHRILYDGTVRVRNTVGVTVPSAWGWVCGIWRLRVIRTRTMTVYRRPYTAVSTVIRHIDLLTIIIDQTYPRIPTPMVLRCSRNTDAYYKWKVNCGPLMALMLRRRNWLLNPFGLYSVFQTLVSSSWYAMVHSEMDFEPLWTLIASISQIRTPYYSEHNNEHVRVLDIFE